MTPNPYKLIKIYLIIELYSLSCFLLTESSMNESDLLSLIAIKDQIEGISSWNQSIHFCQWHGITCNKRHQRVTALELPSQNLAGTLSPHIGNLTFLKFLNLQNNTLRGEIPWEISQLFRLQHLNMSYNAFEGDIPVNLTTTGLRIINLGNNKLSGNIPARLGYLPNLVFLNLETNNLTGVIPSSFGNLSSLQIFSVVDNRLHGSIPDFFGRLPRLTTLLFGVNNFSGEVPLSLYNLSSLEIFALNNNQLIGSLPPNMGITLPNLVDFSAGTNRFSGLLPVSLSNASNFEYFDIVSNDFSGTVPVNLGIQQTLKWINFGHNHLGNGEADDLRFISSFDNSSSIKTMSLVSNNFAGVLPNSIVNITQLEVLQLGDNKISGMIPEGIDNLQNLISLTIEANLLRGSIPSSIGNIKTLQILSLIMNNLTGSIPDSLGNLTQLYELSLASNRLQGSIPSSLQDCQYLQILNLSRNNLSDTIPDEVVGMSSLSIYLDISRNSFTGTMPSTVGRLTNLGYLDVSGNMLSGEIPGALGNCLSMEELHMDNNLFVGVIPRSLNSLGALRYIDLSSNNLSGEIPRYLENFRHLEILNLSSNNLEGEVPTKGVFGNASGIAVAGNVKLCGGIHELRLPKCQIINLNKKGRSLAFKLAIGIGVAMFVIFASGTLILCLKRRLKRDAVALASNSVRGQNFKVSYRDLLQATGGFSPNNFLGSGSCGNVYKGILHTDKPTVVAVKVFNLQHKGAAKSFIAECESLRNIRHRNLVKILTSCSSIDSKGNDFKALVFEFMPNGSLEKWLHQEFHDKDGKPRNLNLLQRVGITIDVASALSYLHHECHDLIIHRDLKPSNVLLDDDMRAHVSDFGIAKLLSVSMEDLLANQSTSIGVKGSIGYAAPEYGMGGEASIQGDIYSYGILLLEIFIGRRPTDEIFVDGLNIHNYASKALLDQVTEIVDPVLLVEEDEMNGDINSTRNDSYGRGKLLECVTAMIRIGVACSVELPAERMDIREVTRELQLIRDNYLHSISHGEISYQPEAN